MRYLLVLFVIVCGAGCAVAGGPTDPTVLEEQVRSVEKAFARTMADRDFAAFKSHLAPDAIFFAADRVLRGREAVAAAWAPLFEDTRAPFSWAPETVAVQQGGQLALSTGPVFDSSGKQIGVFNSVWRREPDGRWLIIFDKGGAYCAPPLE